jgi:hypothetical protein
VTGTGNIATGTGVGNQVLGDGNQASGTGSGNTVTGIQNIANGTGSGNLVLGNANLASGSGSGNSVTGGSNIATGSGSGNEVAGGNNFATGTNAGNEVTGDNNIAVGNGAGNKVAASNAIAVGTAAYAAGNSSIAIGKSSYASHTGSTAIGAGSTVSSKYSTALGAHTVVQEPGGVAIGVDAKGNGAVATDKNQVVIGTGNQTYTTPGITSKKSRNRQSGPLELVTTDANGNLASDGGNVFAQLDEMNARLSDHASGIALAMSMEAPDLVGAEKFGFAVNWGNFEGSNALSASLAGVLGNNVFTGGDRVAMSAGLGVGFASGEGKSVYGGRVGLQWTH